LFSNNSELFSFQIFLFKLLSQILFSKFFSTTIATFIFLSTFVLKLYFHFIVQKKSQNFSELFFLLYISFTISIVFLVFKLVHQNFDGLRPCRNQKSISWPGLSQRKSAGGAERHDDSLWSEIDRAESNLRAPVNQHGPQQLLLLFI